VALLSGASANDLPDPRGMYPSVFTIDDATSTAYRIRRDDGAGGTSDVFIINTNSAGDGRQIEFADPTLPLKITAWLKFKENASDPAAVADHGTLYSKDATAISELFYRNDAGTVTQITAAGALNIPDHGSDHERAGSDQIDGDHLDIDFTPSNYTPSTAPAEAANVDDLAAHLAGIDNALATTGGAGDDSNIVIGTEVFH